MAAPDRDKYPGFILEDKGGVYYQDPLYDPMVRLAGFLDGLETPADGWQVALQMQQIAREALGAKHVEFPPLRRECRIEVDEALEFISGLGAEQSPSTQETVL